MKYLLKGIGLGLTLNVANRVWGVALCGLPFEVEIFISTVIFGIIITAFLVSDDVAQLMICGFTGLFTMFLGEIFIFTQLFSFPDFFVYIGGLCGAVFAVILAIILTVNHVKPSAYFAKAMGEPNMKKPLQGKLMLYAIISAISFSYLVLPEDAAISVPVFVVLQFIMLWQIVPDKKRLLLLVPVFFMSLNCFISASTIWRTSNLIISVLLYCSMFADIRFGDDTFAFITNTVKNVAYALTRFALPFQWVMERSNEKSSVIKRIAVAVVAAIPCAIILIIILSNADMVFSLKTDNFISQLSAVANENAMVKGTIGIVAGLFLFGVLYNAQGGMMTSDKRKQYKGDLIIINILLVTILLVYTLFVIIQFKYLFAGSTLPDGLTYTQYARKGFFELLALTGVNIAIILTVTKLTKTHSGKWQTVCKILCHYLCGVTIVLLVSSFYRMFLYTSDDGLTRLRLFVMGFLLFEAIGLIMTFLYIAKPKFNIVLVYTVLALTYYSLLNLVPADNIIAKNQIDKYLNGEREDIEYVLTLSADSVPALKQLYQTTEDELLKGYIDIFVERRATSHIPKRWQRYRLSQKNVENFYHK